jgi:poly-beta-1,6-N-acetyl-D-glucosamine N-deacetylase
VTTTRGDATAERTRAAAMALMPELQQTGPRRPKYRHRFVQLLTAAVTVVLVAGVFGSAWWYHRWKVEVGHQVDTATPAPLPGELARYRDAAADAPPGSAAVPIVLSYHDVRPGGDNGQYTLTPQNFAAQMRMLHAAGFTSLTAAQFSAYLAGDFRPPPRSVLITFDDGTRGLYTYADKILERYGMHGISFLITGHLDSDGLASDSHRYYLTWRQTKIMSDSGRWDFEAHTRDLHDRGPVDAQGTLAPMLTNRQYVDGRLETLTEFRARVGTDLRQNIKDFTDHGLRRPQFFAWPFSDIPRHARDVAAGRAVTDLVSRLFSSSFVNLTLAPEPATRRGAAQGPIERREVLRDDTAESVFQSIEEMTTLPVRSLEPTTVDDHWLDASGTPSPVVVSEQSVRPKGAPGLRWTKAEWAPQRTSSWSSYEVSATVTGLESSGSNTGGLCAAVGAEQELCVRTSATYLVVTSGQRTVVQRRLMSAGTSHDVTVAVSTQAARVVVDGDEVARLASDSPAARVGSFAVVASRGSDGQTFPSFASLHVRPWTGG